ncbi:50S ribosomal protein L17 [Candidatus Falkowbacteria bacterium]|nr:50S ribosomal protein L17 [Candidatus Falkowbacteria bacterium]
MANRIKGKKLDRKKEPREMMLRNLASSVLIYEKVTTTEAKAKAVKPLVEKTITLAKKGDLNSIKKMISVLPQKMAVKKAIEVLGAKYKDRKGGYTRIIKLGTRAGDGAKVVQLELV